MYVEPFSWNSDGPEACGVRIRFLKWLVQDSQTKGLRDIKKTSGMVSLKKYTK
jgi:hypothetical protein